MIKNFHLKDDSFHPAETAETPIQIYINPDAAERYALRKTFRVDEHTLSSALDPDEVSRIELKSDHIFLVWKRPKNFSGGGSFFFDVASVGLLLTTDRLVIITTDDISLHGAGVRHALPLSTPMDAMLDLLSITIHHYLEHLKVIKAIARELQQKINTSMENKHLIQMFNLSESLIYYINAISSNGVVLTRLHRHCIKTGLAPDIVAFIDDLIVENDQCYKQAKIYSTVFSGLMDARGNLVNNNVNTLLKNLTVINVVFLPLNLIAGIGGMSEYSMMTSGIDWRISYGAFGVAMVLLGWFFAVLLRRMDVGNGGGIRVTKWKRRREPAG